MNFPLYLKGYMVIRRVYWPGPRTLKVLCKPGVCIDDDSDRAFISIRVRILQLFRGHPVFHIDIFYEKSLN